MSTKIMSCPLSTALSLLYQRESGIQRFSRTIWSQCLRATKVACRPAGHRVQLVADLLTEVQQKCVFSGVKTSPPLLVRSEVSARRIQDTGTTSAGTPGLSEAAIKDSELTSGRASTTALSRSSLLHSWFCPPLQYAEKLWGENSASILGSRHGG